MSLPLTRRQLLGGGALLAAGWVTAQVLGRWPAPIGSPYLGPTARRALEAAFDALLPDPTAAGEVASGVDAFLADSDPVLSGQLRVALRLLEQAGGFRPWSNARFSDRSREEREAILAAWERSRIGPLRQVAAALRKVAMFSYYSRPASWPETGYDGPWVGR